MATGASKVISIEPLVSYTPRFYRPRPNIDWGQAESEAVWTKLVK